MITCNCLLNLIGSTQISGFLSLTHQVIELVRIHILTFNIFSNPLVIYLLLNITWCFLYTLIVRPVESTSITALFMEQRDQKLFYRRNLPHWQPRNAIIFITWRLHGSLPETVFEELIEEKERLEDQPPDVQESERTKAARNRKRLFGMLDRKLQTHRQRVNWLRDERIADLVVNEFFRYHQVYYDLYAYCVLPNHIHLLCRPLPFKTEYQFMDSESDPLRMGTRNQIYYPISKITKSIKGYTAKKANSILDRSQSAFWQDESFDHWVRNRIAFQNVIEYIESDPVRWGIVDEPSEWRWSSSYAKKTGKLLEEDIEFVKKD